MKKIALLLLGVCLSGGVFADGELMLFNKSKYDVTISYKFCSSRSNSWPIDDTVCSEETTATIKGVKNAVDKNYIVLTPPMIPIDLSQKDPINGQSIFVSSAIEKDENGKVISQSKYTDINSPYNPQNLQVSGCSVGSGLIMVNKKDGQQYIERGGAGLVFSDMGQSPVIACQYIFYGGMVWKKVN